MPRSKSSHRWLREHFNDPYVKASQKDGLRSRASYKLLELDQKDRLFRNGMTVLDLGAAPGGWSQVAAGKVGSSGRVIASDILPMDALEGVEFIQGDFTEDAIYQEIISALGDNKADVVISDMAPNMSGMAAIDQPKAMYLVELAFDMAGEALKPGGSFVAKVFQGEGFDELFRGAKNRFKRCLTRKPDASRGRSREVYLVATGFKA